MVLNLPTTSVAPLDSNAAQGHGIGGGSGRALSLRDAAARYGLPRALLYLVIGQPQPKLPRLRPTGYNAFIERIAQPMVVIATLGMTCAAIYVMARPLLEQISEDIGHGTVPSLITLLVIGVLFVSGFLLDTCLITAGSRLRMHIARGEKLWAVINGFMLALTLGAESITWVYLLYELDPGVSQLLSQVAPQALQFIRVIPGILFFVRAFLGPTCLIYLTAFVLPLTIQRGDVDRQAAAISSAAIVALIGAIAKQVEEVVLDGSELGVHLLDMLLTLLRVSTKQATEAQDKELVAAFGNLSATIERAAPLLRQTNGAHTATRTVAQSVHALETLDGARDSDGVAAAEGAATSDTSERIGPAGASGEDLSTRGQRFVESARDEPPTRGRGVAVQGTSDAAGNAEVSSTPRRRGKAAAGGVSGSRATGIVRANQLAAKMRSVAMEMQMNGQTRSFYTIARALQEAGEPNVTADEVRAIFVAQRAKRANDSRPGVRPAYDAFLDDPELVPELQESEESIA